MRFSWKRALRWVLWTWVSVSLPALAQAQYAPREGFRLERWSSPATGRDGFAVMRPEVLPHLVWSAQILTSYSLRPLVLRDPRHHNLVAHRLNVDLVAALGLWDRLQLYGRLPFTALSIGEDVLHQQTHFQAPSGSSMGDAALGLSASMFSAHGFTLGARAELLLPSGRQTQLNGDTALAPRGHGLAEYQRGLVSFALSYGAVYRPHRDYAGTRIGSELEWGMLLRLMLRRDTEVLLEAFGTRGLRARALASAADSLDFMLGARRTADTGAVRLRVGTALGTGVSRAVGEPDLRAMLQIAVEPLPVTQAAPAPRSSDRDGDGIGDEHDECPSAPEDHDGFEDADGCPEDDNDHDGVPDARDHCPNQLGELPFGCPLPDADADSIPDERDRCPDDPETHNGIRDEDGCPERDLDGDGIDDDTDRCVDVAGPADHGGCPVHARFAGEQLALLTQLSFTDGALAAGSEPVLDDIAASLQARPLLSAVLAVWGSSEASSLAQAEALKEALVARGVHPERLRSIGQVGSARLVIQLKAPPVYPLPQP